MRLIIVSDLHIHNWREFSKIDPDTGLNSRMMDGIRVLQQVHDYANENGIGNILFLGDLFERGNLIPPDILEQVVKELRAIRDDRIVFHAIVGNHDQMSIGGRRNALKPLEDYIVPYSDAYSGLLDRAGEVGLVVIPARRTLEEQYEEFNSILGVQHGSRYTILAGHFYCKQLLDADGVPPGGMESIDFDEVPKIFREVDHWFLGDYHRSMIVQRDGCVIESLGAVMHHSFSDVGRQQGQFLDLVIGDTVRGKYISVHAPMFIDVTYDDFMEHKHISTDFYRVHVSTTEQHAVVLDFIKNSRFDWNVRLVFDNPVTTPCDLRADMEPSMSPERIISEYVDQFGGPEGGGRIKQLGVKYLREE